MRHKPHSTSGTHQLQIPLLPYRIHPKRLKVRKDALCDPKLPGTWRNLSPDLSTLPGEAMNRLSLYDKPPQDPPPTHGCTQPSPHTVSHAV